ncbi:MAG TPA: SMC-Scp complex subunit ScpB [Candidatus Magasanikbacteria bacterium]|nr:SMC-Scp complex subunit ScpB [Candidatus Magasanikbacteria bacterium]
MSLESKTESLLFIAAKPLSFKKIAELLKGEVEEVKEAVEKIKQKYNQPEFGIRILQEGNEVQMSTNPENSSLIKDYLKDEMTGELTRPSLEALTIIAYRGPITKLELEQIRGVNCSLILRNLLLRGLVKEEMDEARVQNVYTTTFDFLRLLGLNETKELPDYEKLHSHDLLERLLTDLQQDNNNQNTSATVEENLAA